MKTEKNKPPVMFFVGMGLLVLMIVAYFIITALMPGVFHGLSTGAAPAATK